MHQRQLKHPIEIYFKILEDVLQRSFRTIFSQKTWNAVNDGSVKPHKVIMLNVFHHLKLHHEGAIEISRNHNFLNGDGVAFITTDGDENLLIEIFRIDRLKQSIDDVKLLLDDDDLTHQLRTRSGVYGTANLIGRWHWNHFIPVDSPSH